MIRFLTLKHWQLFGLLIGLPLTFHFVAIGLVISNSNPAAFFYIFSAVMALFYGTLSGWFYALGTNLHKKLPPTVSMNLTLFKSFLLIWATYGIMISFFMSNLVLSPLGEDQLNSPLLALIVPLHLFSMFCIFYCLYFNAKALKAAELQRPVTFSDFAGDFFLMWFFPIGIWVIQPRINELFDTIHN